jgi:hypothetical protein
MAKGLKELRMGDILELYLDERLERKILNVHRIQCILSLLSPLL